MLADAYQDSTDKAIKLLAAQPFDPIAPEPKFLEEFLLWLFEPVPFYSISTFLLFCLLYAIVVAFNKHRPIATRAKTFFAWKMRLSNFNKRILLPLNTMTKRIGALILMVGLLTLSIGLFEIFDDRDYKIANSMRGWWNAVMQNYYHGYNQMAAWGTYLSIIGLSLSYLYDRGIGRIVRWIRVG